MEENEVTIDLGEGLSTIKIDQLPEMISSQIDSITALEKKVATCDDSAKQAMEYVSSQMTRYQEKGKWIFRHRSGNTKDSIVDTQNAVDMLAAAQNVSTEALKQSFEFQKKLADVSKYLFDLGCANITTNRISVRAIEAKLSGASKDEISELARQEMLSVVKQLKEQEDILNKQEEIKTKVKSLVERLNENDELDEKLAAQINALYSQLSEKDRIDEEQSKRISENEEDISVLYEFMKNKNEFDKEQSEKIEGLKKDSGKLLKVATVLSIIAIVLGVTNLILQFVK